MPPIKFTFKREKAMAAILYIASKIPDPTYHSISKILYFADKTSLEQYGRFICGDAYFAMEYGPVPSETYDLMKNAGENGVSEFRIEDRNKLIPLQPPDLDELSESDIEVLDSMIDLYGHTPFWKKTQDSHDDAWRLAWENRGERQSSPMSVESIVAMLEDADDLLAHLQGQDE